MPKIIDRTTIAAFLTLAALCAAAVAAPDVPEVPNLPPPGRGERTVCRELRQPGTTKYVPCIQCCIVVDTPQGPVQILCETPRCDGAGTPPPIVW